MWNDTLWFSWDESFDPNDDSLTYFFSGSFYSEDGSSDTLKGIDTINGRTDYDISHYELNDWLDSLGVNEAVLQWNVEAWDDSLGTYAENGPFHLLVQYENTPPNEFELLEPEYDTTIEITASSVAADWQETFRWQPAIDPDADDVWYNVVWTMYGDSTDIEYEGADFEDTSAVLDHGMLSGWLDSLGVTEAPMDWRVIAYDEGGDLTSSEEFSLYIDGTAIVNDPPEEFWLNWPEDSSEIHLTHESLYADTAWFDWEQSWDEETDSLMYTINWAMYDVADQSDTLYDQDIQPENWTWISYAFLNDLLDSLGTSYAVLEWNVSVTDGTHNVDASNGPNRLFVDGYSLQGMPNLRIYEMSTNHHVQVGEMIGDSIFVSIVNDGNADADSFSVGFYFSEDSMLTTDDVLLNGGREILSGLAAGDTAIIDLPYEASVPELEDGIYHFGPIIDEMDEVEEYIEDDNAWWHFMRVGNPEFSLSFDGESDYVNFGDPEDESLDFADNPFSYALWVKTENSGFMQLVSKRGEEGGSYEMQMMSDGYVSTDMVSSSTMINDGQWHHVAYTWSGDSAKLYIDGSLESVGAPQEGQSTYASSDGPLHIGSDSYQGEFFTGNLDDFRIWNRELDASEIRPNMYFHPNWGDDMRPVGYWPMNEGLGDTVRSWTENELSGAITGAIWSEDVPDKPDGEISVSITAARQDSGYIWVGLWFPGSDFETRGPDIGRDSVFVNFADSTEHMVYFNGIPDGEGYVVRSIFDAFGSATAGTDSCDDGQDLWGESDPFNVIAAIADDIELVLNECSGPNTAPYWVGIPADTSFNEDDSLWIDFGDYIFDDTNPLEDLSISIHRIDSTEYIRWYHDEENQRLVNFHSDPDAWGNPEDFIIFAEDPNFLGAWSDTITISVDPVPDAPRITSGSFYEILVDTYFTYVAEGHDPDGDSVMWSFSNMPAWLTADADSMYGTPAESGTVDTVLVTASDGTLADSLEVTISVVDQNTHPIIDINMEMTEYHHMVPFEFSLVDLEDDSMSYVFYYSLDSLEWFEATVGEVPPELPISAPSLSVKGGSVLNIGNSGRKRTDLQMEWDSWMDIGDTHAFDVWLRTEVSDGSLTSGMAVGPFSVDNFVGSIWFTDYPSGEVSGTISISYNLSDPSNDEYTMTLEYSTDGGSSWMEPTLNSPISDPLLPSDYIGTLTWNTENDLANSDEQVLMALTIHDGWEYGFADTVDFAVDNQSLIGLVSYSPDTAGQLSWYDNFVLFFPGEVDQTSLESDISLEGNMTGTIDASYNVANIGTQIRLTIIPDESVIAGEEVTLTISTDVIDTLGNPYDGNLNGDEDGDLDITVLEYEAALLGDYNFSGLVQFNDLLDFQQAWWNPSTYGGRETGPATGSAPNMQIQPDGVIDFEDLMVFIQMWNWSQGYVPNDGWMAKIGNSDAAGTTVEASFPDKQIGQDVETILIMVDVDSLKAIGSGEVLMSYDPAVLEFRRAIKKLDDQWIILSNAADADGMLRINIADFGRDENSGSRIFELEFRTLNDQHTSLTWQADFRSRTGDIWENASGTIYFSTVPPMPVSYTLHQNFPNPFNPVTEIRYDLPDDVYVRLAVYDIRGREVTVLAEELKAAGFHSAVWNGTDSRGIPASAGIYFLRINTPTFHATKKMMLLK